MTPRVSVLIGAYNNAATLEAAMRSMLAQTVTDLELIVVDDGSADDSRAVALRVNDPRVRVIGLDRNVGISTSLNRGLREARAPIVAVQDADDFSAPDRLERQLAVFDARPEVAVVGSRMDEIDADGRPLVTRTTFAAGDVNPVLLRFNPIPNTSAAVRRDVVLALGGYDPRYRYAAEYDLWLRVAEHHVVHAIDAPLSTRRMSTTNVAARKDREQMAEVFLIAVRAVRRRRSLRGAWAVGIPALAWLTPAPLKRWRRRRLGQSA